MPGTKYRRRLYMRFRVQFYSATRQDFVATDSSSRWLRVGSGRARATQSGFNFRFDDPPAGEQFVLRGVVQFRYTAKRRRNGKTRWRVVKQYERLTRSGQRGVQAADPRRRLLRALHHPAGNRRGSFVITASAPSASMRAICFGSSTVHT